MSSRVVAILFCFFLGGIGAHHFYMKKSKLGAIYLFLCWTYIPSLISLFDLFKLVSMSDDEFNELCSSREDPELPKVLIGSGIGVLFICLGLLALSQSCNPINGNCSYSQATDIERIKSVLPYLFGLGGILLLGGFIKSNGESNKKLSTTNISTKDSTNTLYDLKKLYEEGIITAEEYEAKRRKILDKI